MLRSPRVPWSVCFHGVSISHAVLAAVAALGALGALAALSAPAVALGQGVPPPVVPAGPPTFSGFVTVKVAQFTSLGVSLASPRVWGLHFGLEAGVREFDEVDAKGKLDRESYPEGRVFVLTRQALGAGFHWASEVGLGLTRYKVIAPGDGRGEDPRGKNVSHFEGRFGVGRFEPREAGGWGLLWESGVLFRFNDHDESLLVGGQEKLRTSEPGVFLSFGVGV